MQVDFSELGNYFFDITDIFAMEQTAAGKTTFIMEESRPTDALLLFVSSAGICYRDGLSPLCVSQGSLVYLPRNSRYIWENSPAPDCDSQRNLLFEFSLGHTAVYSGNYGGCLYSYSDYESAFTGFGQDFHRRKIQKEKLI